MSRAFFFSSLCLVLASACGGGTDSDGGTLPGDGGAIDAASATDGGASDGGGGSDAGPDVDGGEGTDGGGADAGGADAGTSDAGPTPTDGGLFCDDLGKPCTSDTECGGGYTCDTFRHACLPPMGEARPFCGGFVGAPCPTTGMYTVCNYLTSADIGPCLTPDEALCACMPPAREHFSMCP
ncbi:MAG: hypothetical protein H6719_17205 [Sandaracinaceae bacterium]|nr:hypothetical protein [Sandaracinaceae bacterium]